MGSADREGRHYAGTAEQHGGTRVLGNRPRHDDAAALPRALLHGSRDTDGKTPQQRRDTESPSPSGRSEARYPAGVTARRRSPRKRVHHRSRERNPATGFCRSDHPAFRDSHRRGGGNHRPAGRIHRDTRTHRTGALTAPAERKHAPSATRNHHAPSGPNAHRRTRSPRSPSEVPRNRTRRQDGNVNALDADIRVRQNRRTMTMGEIRASVRWRTGTTARSCTADTASRPTSDGRRSKESSTRER